MGGTNEDFGELLRKYQQTSSSVNTAFSKLRGSLASALSDGALAQASPQQGTGNSLAQKLQELTGQNFPLIDNASISTLDSDAMQQPVADEKSQQAEPREGLAEGVSGDNSDDMLDIDRQFCRRFAAGFCPDGWRCKHGTHHVLQTQTAVEAWLERSPSHAAGVVIPSEKPLLLVMEYSTGSIGPRSPSSLEEIVEIAIIGMCSKSGREVGRFHFFVKPSALCREDSDKLLEDHGASCFPEDSDALPFADCLADLLDWIPSLLGVPLDSLQKEDFLFVTDGDGAVQSVLPRQCSIPAPEVIDPALQDILFSRWASLQDVYNLSFSLFTPESLPPSAQSTVEYFSQAASGNYDTAMNNVVKISGLVKGLISYGVPFDVTAVRAAVDQPPIFVWTRRNKRKPESGQPSPEMESKGSSRRKIDCGISSVGDSSNGVLVRVQSKSGSLGGVPASLPVASNATNLHAWTSVPSQHTMAQHDPAWSAFDQYSTRPPLGLQSLPPPKPPPPLPPPLWPPPKVGGLAIHVPVGRSTTSKASSPA